VPRCGYKPQGYEPCIKELGHEGKCRCKLVDFESVAVDLESVAIDFDSTPSQLEELFRASIEGMYGRFGKA